MKPFTVSDSFNVLFIGNFSQQPPPKSLLTAFENLLLFAVDLGKLGEDYSLKADIEFGVNKDKLDEALRSSPFGEHFDSKLVPANPLIRWDY